MIRKSEIEAYFNTSENEYDIRKTNNARWIDQKCTPDVLCIVSDCVLNYYIENDEKDEYFKSKDIWYAEYTLSLIHI